MGTSLSAISSTQLRRAARIKEKIEKLQRKLDNVIGNGTGSGSVSGHRNLSPDARERIAAAQRKRWAAYRKAKGK